MAYKDPEKKKAYHKIYHKKWYEANKAKRTQQIEERKNRLRVEVSNKVNNYKLENGCTDCGYNDYAIALDFDHTDNNKLYNVSNLVGMAYSFGFIMKEIEKCEVVCANCHRVRTQNRRQSPSHINNHCKSKQNTSLNPHNLS